MLAASIWIGGHLVLAIGYVPRLLRGSDLKDLLAFEKTYEKLGLPSLIIAVVTGVYMGLQWYPIDAWFTGTGKSWLLGVKMILLLTTVGLAIDARLRLIPKAKRGENINIYDLALHIILVTIIAVGFLIAGWSLRYI
jgi:putative copper export protein